MYKFRKFRNGGQIFCAGTVVFLTRVLVQGECEHYNFDTSTDGFCMPDERYAATVLNFYNQTGTVANTGITFSDWTSWGRSRDGAHPRTFWKGQAEFAVSLLLDSYNGGSLDGCAATDASSISACVSAAATAKTASGTATAIDTYQADTTIYAPGAPSKAATTIAASASAAGTVVVDAIAAEASSLVSVLLNQAMLHLCVHLLV